LEKAGDCIMYKWKYNEEVTAEEFIQRLIPLVCGPVDTLWNCEGDMFMSDFHKLCEAARQLEQVKRDLESNVKED
tara:strand:- start:398 stop:622 length:225 start_codon:yes stop_codon:yes gene_type:complete